MTIGLQIVDGATPVFEKLERDLPNVLERGLLSAATYAAGEIRRQVFARFGGKNNRTTGNLANSFTATLLQSRGGNIAAGAMSDLIYAGIQNRGGTITAKGKALTVPIGMGKTLPVGARARDVPGLVLISRPGKPGLLVRPRKKAFDLYFVLVKSVNITGRRYIEAAAKEAETEVIRILDEAAQGGINKAEG